MFRPDPENCCTPSLRLLSAVSWPVGERPVALAAHPDRGLALLSWFGDGEARLRRLDADSGRLTEPVALVDARYAYAFDWLDAERIAVRMPGRRDAPAFVVPDGASERVAARRDPIPSPVTQARRHSRTASPDRRVIRSAMALSSCCPCRLGISPAAAAPRATK